MRGWQLMIGNLKLVIENLSVDLFYYKLQIGLQSKAGEKEGQRAESVRRQRIHASPNWGSIFWPANRLPQRIVEALGDVSRGDVLEIGPGRGAITEIAGTQRAQRLIAVEVDRVLSAQLRMKFALHPNVEIIEGDILTIELDTVFGPKPGELRPDWRLRLSRRA